MVFYLSRALDGGEAEDRTAALVIDSSKPNYLPLARNVTLRITVLQNPTLAAAVGTIGAGAPYGSNALHNFKTGDYAAATNFERDAANSDSELAVNANTGVVSTSGDIARAGTYNLVVSVTSPDFAGAARLELQLTLEAENALPAKDTIPGDARGRTIFVAPGYSGSVAFFAANKGGVALRLPPSAPAGFGFGGNGLNAEFESPDGFTLFLNAGQIAAGAARAVFAVTARASGFIDTRIWVTVSVAAVTPPPQPTLTALHQDALYGAVAAPADYPLENPAIAGAAVYAFGGGLVSLDDWANRVKIENGRLLPFGAGDDSRLAAGIYQITVRTTHSGFLGGLSLTVPVNVQETFDVDDVLSAEARNATVTVVTGHSGPGYQIPLSVGYVFQTVLSDANYDVYRNIIEIPESAPIGAENLELAVTAAAICVAWRNCAPGARTLTVSVTFVPLFPAAQNALDAVYDDDFAPHTLNLPSEYQTGATAALLGVSGGADNLFALNAANEIVRNADNTPPAGAYEITLGVTHGDFVGVLTLDVTATIRPANLNEADYGLPSPARVTAAAGYTGYLYTDISLRAAATDGVLATPLGAFPSGVSLSLLSDSRGAAAHITAALDGEEFRPEVTLTVSRGANYVPLAQTVALDVVVLRAPPIAEADGETFGLTPSFRGAVVNLAGAGYENGAYAGARFEEKSPSSKLRADEDGLVSTRENLGAGDYLLTVVARGRPNSGADAGALIGDAEITVSLRVSQGSEDVTADDVVPPASRNVTLDAAAGHFGRGYKIPVRVNYTLSAENYDPAELGYDDVNKVIFVLSGNSVPTSGELTLTLSGDGGCNDGIRSCLPVPVSVTAVFRAVEAPEQATLTASHLDADYDGRGHALAAPEGFAFSGATLSVAGEHGLRFAIVADKLQPVDADNENSRPEVGKYAVTVAMTHEGFLGTLSLPVPVRVRETVREGQAAGVRTVSQPAVAGHFGAPGPVIQVASGYTLTALTYDEAAFSVVAEEGGYEVQLAAPMPTVTLEAALTADVVCEDESRDCAPLKLSVTVTFTPVLALAQNTLNADYNEDFAPHALNLPSEHQTGATVTLSGVSGGADDLFTLNAANAIVRNADNTPPAGSYEISMAVTHAGFLGTLTFEVSATIRRLNLGEADYGLPQPERVTLAAGYTGYLYTDISLRAAATEGVLATPLGAFPSGVSLSLLSDSRGAAAHITAALDGEEFRPEVTLTVSRGANYVPLPQTVALDVTVLRAPPIADADGETFGVTPSFGGNVFTLADAGYESGVYAGARFEEKSPSSKLQADADGLVSTKENLGAGDYLLTVIARGRPDSGADADAFIGDAEITVSLRVSQGSDSITADDVVLPAARNVTLDAAAGHFGRGYKIPVENNYTLSAENYDDTELGYDDVNEVISILQDRPIPNSGELTLTLSGDGECGDGVRICNIAPVSVTVVFRAVAAAAQNGAAEDFLEGFTVTLKLPSGYAFGDGKSGRELSLIVSEELLNVSLSVDAENDELEYAPNGVESGALSAGARTVTVALTAADLLGTVFMEVAATVSPRALAADQFGLSPAVSTVTVAAGDGAVRAELARVSLSDAAAGAAVVLPASFPENISLALENGGRDAVFYLTTALDGGSVAERTARLTVTLDGNHLPLAQEVTLQITVLQTVLVELEEEIPYSSDTLHDFKTRAYAESTQFEYAGSNSQQLTVGSDGVVFTRGQFTVPGIYTLAVSVTSPDFIGTARLELRLTLTRKFSELDTIPTAGRNRSVAVVPGYAGSVAFFAAASVGVTLRTPSSAPSGFNLGDGGLDADFKSPNGFTLFLNAEEIKDGDDAASATLTVTAKAAGFTDIPIELTVIVSAVSTPAQNGAAADFLEGFTVGLNLPSGYAFGDGKSGRALSLIVSEELSNVSLSVDANDRLAYAPNGVESDALNVGAHTVTVALTATDLLGTVLMEFAATVNPRPLNADRFGLSPALSAVTIAAGGGAVGLELARVSLSETAAEAVVVLPDSFPDNVSLALESGDREAVFYLTARLDGGSVTVAAAQLTVTLDGNHLPLAQDVRVQISALQNPARVTLEGKIPADNAYFNNNLHNFKTEVYAGATNFERDRESSSGQLRVDESAGVVFTQGGITAPGIYTLAVSVTSPDFVGAARLELQLVLGAAGEFLTSETIPREERIRAVAVAPGYAGSVAFFAAKLAGVTLRTPSSVSEGFHLGGGLDADFKSPDGFTLFLNAGRLADGDDSASATLAVTAKAAGVADSEIGLTVSVLAVAAPAQDGATKNFLEGFTVGLNLPSGYASGDGKAGRALSLIVSEGLANVSLSLDAENDALAYAPNGVESDALPSGAHTVTVALTAADLLGTLFMEFAATVRFLSEFSALDAIAEGKRVLAVTVVPGHTGSVGFFAAGLAGATLRTPALSPSGFGFETGAAFESPDGFAVSLTTALSAGGELSGRFEVTVARAGYADALLTLRLTARALPSPPLPDLPVFAGPFSGAVFDFGSRSYAGGAYANAEFEEASGAGASADLDVGAGGEVSTARALEPGVYGLTALATSDDYLGTARLAVSLTVGWRVAYAGDPSADGTVSARGADGSAVSPGSAVAPNALVTLTAEPSLRHYVSGWEGACASDGGVGDNANPGVAQACALTATAAIGVTARFRRSSQGALVVFGEESVFETGQTVQVAHDWDLTQGANTLTLEMVYHGVYRNLHVMRLTTWSISVNSNQYTTPDNGQLRGDRFAGAGFAAGTCGPAGWRVPTAGEVAGVSYDGDAAQLEAAFAGGKSNDIEQAPAGALRGLAVALPAKGGGDTAAAVEPGFYELDSRDVSGNYAAVRYHSDGDVRFPRSSANRWVMCVKGAEELPELAAVLLESGGQTVGHPVARTRGTQSPSFTVTVTLSSSAVSGDELFAGTVYSWKHKDAPEILSKARPLATLLADAAGYAVTIADAAGDAGTEMRIRVGSNRPAYGPSRATVSLAAWHALGITATIEVVADILPLTHSEYAPLAAPGGALTATLADGTAVAPGGRVNYGADLHVRATPDAGYYVHSWGGLCAGAATGSAGEAKTCVVRNVRTPTVAAEVFFGRDECAAPSPCGANATCSDADPLTAGTAVCACDAGFESSDGGRTCVARPLDDAIAAEARTVTAYVSPSHAGSVAFFAATLAGATLRTPATSPAGFGFERNAEFVSPAGFAVSLLSPAGSGNALTGSFAVAARASGYSEGLVSLRVEVSALATPLAAAGGNAYGSQSQFYRQNFLDLSGADYAGGAYAGARFARKGESPDLNVDEDGLVSALRRLGEGSYLLTVAARGRPDHPDAWFIGEAELTVSLRVSPGTLTVRADRVVASAARHVTLDAVAGYAGRGYAIPVEKDYALRGERYDTAEMGYDADNDVMLILAENKVPAAGELTLTLSGDGECDVAGLLCTTVAISVTAVFRAVAAPEQATLTALFSAANYDGLGHDLAAPAGFALADGTLSVSGAAGARFAIVANKLQPADASDAARRPQSGEQTVTVEMTHGGFLGTLSLSVPVRIREALSADAVLSERERVQDAVAGHFGSAADAGHALTVGAGYTLSALSAGAGAAVAAKPEGYEVRLLSALGDATVTASFEGDVRCEPPRDCLPLRLSVTVRFAPLIAPPNGATMAWQDTDEDIKFNSIRLNVPSRQEFEDAGYELIRVSHNDVENTVSATWRFAVNDARGRGIVFQRGNVHPDLGDHELLVELKRPGGGRNRGFLGTLTLTVKVKVVRGRLHGDWRLSRSRGNVQRASARVAPGYAGLAHQDYVLTYSESAKVRTVGASPPGFAAGVSADGLTALVSLTGETPAPALGTLTFEVFHTNPAAATNYISSRRGQTVIVAVTEVAAPAAEAGIRLAPFSGAVFDFGSQSYASGAFAGASFEELSDGSGSAELDVSARGLVTAQSDLRAGVYGITARATSDDYLGAATLALFLTVGWRVAYEGSPSDGGTLAARGADGADLASGGAAAPGALVTFTASPSPLHYVSGWTGGCAPVGEVGNDDNPGVAKDCALTADAEINVTAVFAAFPETIAEDERARTVTVVSGYAGSVAFFAARLAGVTLRTPAAAPEGFGFETGADFESPQGFAVSLTTALPPSGSRTGVFEVVAARAGRAETTVTLRLEVAAMSPPPAQAGAAADYLAGWTVGLNLPPDYAFGDGKPGRALSLIVAEELANVSLSLDAATDRLAYAPNGVASDALPAGAHTVTVALTAADLLGTVLLEFAATVNPRPLDADQFGLSLAPATVTVAAGDGAVGLALARASLFESAAGAAVVLPAAFPRNVSLALASAGREAVFYLTTALDGGSFAEPTARLTVALDANHAPLSQDAALRITVLQNPGVAEVSGAAGAGNPFESGNLYTLKAGDYVNATSFARDSAASSPQLAVDANSGVVSTAEEIAAEGIYTVVASVASPDFVGRARLELRLILGAENAFRTTDTIPTDQRGRSVLIARGYSGSVAFFAARKDGVTLRTPPSAPAGFNLGGGLDADFKAPAGFTLFLNAEGIADDADGASATLTVTAKAAEFIDSEIGLTVSVAAVSAPAQDGAAADYLEGFTVGLRLPPGYEFGMKPGRALSLIVSEELANVSLSADAATDALAYAPNGVADGALPVGAHTVTVALTDAGLLGTVLMEFAATIAPRALDAEQFGLSPAVSTVTVAAGGGAVRAELARVSLSDAAAGAAVVLPAAFPRNVSLALENGGRDAVFYLTTALDGGSAATLAAQLTVTLNSNHAPLPQEVTLQITVLQTVLVELNGEIPRGGSYTANNLHNFKTGDYAGATNFERDSGSSSPGLGVGDEDGRVFTQGGISVPGVYTLVAAVTSPDFAGKARLELRLTLTSAARVFSDAETIPEAERNRSVAAVPGYAGSVAFFAAELSGVTLRTPSSAPEGFNLGAGGLDADFKSPAGFTLFLDAGRLAAGNDASATLAVTAKAANYADSRIDLTVSVAAVTAPAQAGAAADYLEGFTVGLRLPPGYAFGDGKAGRSLSLIVSEGLANVSLSADAATDALAYAPNGVASDALPVGAHTVTVALTAADLLGTVLLEFAATIGPRALDADQFGLSPALSTVTVAAGGGAVGLALARVSLPDAAAGAAVVLPASFPQNVSLALESGGRDAVFYLTTALDGGSVATLAAQLTVTLDGNHLPLPQDVGVQISVLQNPARVTVAGVILRGKSYAADNLHNFKTGDYAGATRIERDEESSRELVVDSSGVVYTRGTGIAAPGVYTLAVSVTSPDFVGAARLEFELTLAAEREFSAEDAIADDKRVLAVTVVPGHTGSVGFFAAGLAGATLRTPALAPSGFGFETGAAFEAPDGFAVSLTTALSAGGELSGDFEVTVARAGYADALLTLRLTARALPLPPLPDLTVFAGPFEGSVFDFGSPFYAGGAYANAAFEEASGAGASADLDVGAGGEVSTARALEPGVYGLTALATSDDYLGTASLAVSLTVGWRVAYAGDPSADGTVSARGADGSAVSPGSAVAPNALVTLTAEPSLRHYVSGWEGACASDGGVGDNANPGVAQACAVTATAAIGVTALFGESSKGALVVFGGESVFKTGQTVQATVGWNSSRGVRAVTLEMVYHGVRRNLHVMRLTTWRADLSNFNANRRLFTAPADGQFSGEAFAGDGFASQACKSAGWRVPTVGEVAGVSYAGNAAQFVTERAGGGGNDVAQAPAGALKGMVVALPATGVGDTVTVVSDDFYELDSRDVSGNYVAVRYHPAGDVRFPTSTASRRVMCVKDAAGAEKLPELAAVLLESGGQTVGSPVAQEANQSPSFTVTVTLSSSAVSGDELFAGTVYSWKHKDAPEILSKARPLATLLADAAGYAVTIADAAGDAGTEMRIRVGSNRPAYGPSRTTVSLAAWHALGITATMEVVVDVLPLTHSEYAPLASSGGALTATLTDGTAVAPGGRVNYGEDLHVRATPDAGYYVHSWGGLCAGAATGSAGESKTCVVSNVRTPTVAAEVFFGRDECAAPSPCGANATCSDADPLTAGTAVCACDAGFESSDGGRTCVARPLDDAIAAEARTVTAYVSPSHAGSVAFFAATLAGATLRTPATSPAGFGFERNAEFVSPAGFAVSLLSPAGSGNALTGSFAVAARASGYSEGLVSLRVEVSALATPLAAAGGNAYGSQSQFYRQNFLDLSGADYAGGAYAGARFARKGGSPDLNVDEDGLVSALRRLGEGSYLLTVAARGRPDHPDAWFIGEAELTVSLRVSPGTLTVRADRVVASAARHVTLDAVAGYAGRGYAIPVEKDYALRGERYDAAEMGYDADNDVMLILAENKVPAAGELTLALSGDGECDVAGLLCTTVAISVTAVFRAVAAPEQATLTALFSAANYDGLGHDLAAPAGFALADGTLSVSGADGARFAIVANKLQPADASDAARRPQSGEQTVTVEMTHGGFLGTLSLSVPVRIREALSADAVLSERERVQDAVAGHFGSAADAGHALTVGAGYTLSALSAGAGAAVAAKPEGYEVRLLSALGDATVTASFEGDVRCEPPRDCLPLRLSVTVRFAPLIAPPNGATMAWQDTDEDIKFNSIRLNVPSRQEFEDAGYDLIRVSHNDVENTVSATWRFAVNNARGRGIVFQRGNVHPDLGDHELLVELKRPGGGRNRGFLGTLTLTVKVKVVRGRLHGDWRLSRSRGNVQRASARVAPGYAGLVHQDYVLTYSESAKVRTVGASPPGFAAGVSADGLTALVSLTGETPAPALGTLTFEVFHTNPAAATNYISSRRGQTVIVAVTEVAAPAAEAGIRLAPFSGAVFDFGSQSYASGAFAGASFEELSDGSGSAELDVSARGLVTTAQSDLGAGVYGITARATSDDYLGAATLALFLTVGWRVAYEGSPSDGGTLAARGADGADLASGGAAAPGALVTFTASPSPLHYVSGWTGGCAPVGEVGNDDNPGVAKDCALTADAEINVTAFFAAFPETIPEDERARTVTVVSGYAGSVAFFAARLAGVTLRTPDAAPEGFGFETGADFESPQGFAVSLTTALPPSGSRTGVFEVVAARAGRAETTVTLRLEVAAMSPPPAQDGAAADYLAGWTVGLNLPPDYAFGDGKPGRALSLIVAEELANVSLSLDAATDRLAYAPNGVADDALPAGAHTVTVALTAADLLGTVLLEFAATVNPRPLDADQFGLSLAPATVTIAAGDGAVGLALARASLFESAAGAAVVLPAAFPRNVSLALASAGREAVFYLTTALDGGSFAEPTARLTVALDANHAPLSQDAALRITVLQNPGVAEVGGAAGAGNPFESDNLYTLKAGDYVNATSFARDSAASSPQLAVDANSGIVSTSEEIAAEGIYTVVASVSSPDFVGRARLELRLMLGAENAFLTTDTIPTDQRGRSVLIARGHSGSVAFFAARKAGVTLRTPSSAPAGFNLGGGLDADFTAPAGFTLFLNADEIADDADGASATLTVTAKAAGFIDSEIGLTVSVAAVSAPAQAGAAADYLEGFTVGLRLPPGYEFGMKAGRALSLIVSEELANVSLSADAATDALAYAPNGVASDALPVGAHTVTVALTDAGLLGTVLMEFAATIAPRALDAEQFGLSPAVSTVTVAAGGGAVRAELARVSLSDAAAGAAVVLPAAFPEHVSLALENGGVRRCFI